MKIAVINDIHAADSPPLGRKGDYREQILDKLRGVVDYCNAEGIGTIILTGDIFHQKRPDRTSHYLVQRLTGIFHAFRNRDSIYAIPGNHDMAEAGLDSLHRQPFGVLVRTGVIKQLKYGTVTLLESAKPKVRVALLARPYNHKLDGESDPHYYKLTDDEKGAADHADCVIMVAHGSIFPNGVRPNYDHIDLSQIDFDGTVDILLSGHIHESLGIHDMHDGTTFINLGSLGRVSRSKEHLDADNVRSFLVISLTEEDVHFEQVPIPNILPPDEVFLEQTEEKQDDAMAEFASSLASSLVLEDQSIEEALAQLGDVPKKVRARLKQYLEGAGL